MAKVTLQSIADRVGVSRMTVSNAFSRPDQLSADLRDADPGRRRPSSGTSAPTRPPAPWPEAGPARSAC